MKNNEHVSNTDHLALSHASHLQPKVIIRLPQLCSILGISKSSVYLKLDRKSSYHDSRLPRPVKIGDRAIGWLLPEVNEYLGSLPKCKEGTN